MNKTIDKPFDNRPTGKPGQQEATQADQGRMVTGLFRDRAAAERAYSTVTNRGYSKDDVNVVMSDATRKKHFANDPDVKSDMRTMVGEGAGIGGAIGGTLGAIAAALVAVGTSLAIPGLGLVIAGPIAAALAGAGAGGLTGGLVGALVGWNIPDERLRYYEKGVNEGGILMGVKPRSDVDAEHIETEWKGHAGEYVYR